MCKSLISYGESTKATQNFKSQQIGVPIVTLFLRSRTRNSQFNSTISYFQKVNMVNTEVSLNTPNIWPGNELNHSPRCP